MKKRSLSEISKGQIYAFRGARENQTTTDLLTEVVTLEKIPVTLHTWEPFCSVLSKRKVHYISQTLKIDHIKTCFQNKFEK